MILKTGMVRATLFCIAMVICNVIISAIIFSHISWMTALPWFTKFTISFGIGFGLMYGELYIIYDKLLNTLKLKEGQVWKRTQERYYIYMETQQLLNKREIAIRLWIRDGNGPLTLACSFIPWNQHMAIRQNKISFYLTGWAALKGKEKAKFFLKQT